MSYWDYLAGKRDQQTGLDYFNNNTDYKRGASDDQRLRQQAQQRQEIWKQKMEMVKHDRDWICSNVDKVRVGDLHGILHHWRVSICPVFGAKVYHFHQKRKFQPPGV